MDEALESHWREFGAYLKELIAKAGLSLGEFAERAHIAPEHASRLINGKSGTRRPSIAVFVGALALSDHDKIRELYRLAGFAVPAEYAAPFPEPSVATFSDTSTGQLEEIRRMIDESQDRFQERILQAFKKMLDEQANNTQK